MTVMLDVIACCCREEGAEPPGDAADQEAAMPVPPPVMPAPSGVFLIHVAPSGRLDPSKLEDIKIEDDLAELDPFIVD